MLNVGRRFHALLLDSIDNLKSVRARSLLALLGIAIGTAAVIALFSIGENAAVEATKQFTSMGTDLIVVQNGLDLGVQQKLKPILLQDAIDLQREIPDVLSAVPLTSYAVKTSRALGNGERVSIGTSEGFLDIARLQLDQGRFVRNADEYDTVVVLGSETAKAIAQSGQSVSLGARVRMDGYLYTVVGILKNAPKNQLLPFDIDNAFIVPLKSSRRMLMATGGVSNVLIRVKQDAEPHVVALRISQFLNRQGKSAQAQAALQLIEGMKKQSQLFTWMLAGVASISLLVGGIGVMNVMLAGLADRKKEIGLRLAIGADRMSIMMMVICESTMLSVIGGSVGVFLGLAFSVLFAVLSGWGYVLSVWAIFFGFGMSLFTGIFFGVYPARKASQMSPVEALRSE